MLALPLVAYMALQLVAYMLVQNLHAFQRQGGLV